MKNIKKIDILILILVVILSYAAWNKYKNNILSGGNVLTEIKKEESENQAATSSQDKKPESSLRNNKIKPEPANLKESHEEQTGAAPISPPENIGIDSVQEDAGSDEEEEQEPGFYQNKTFGYEIYFPESWPIKEHSQDHIVIGTNPPKNGQGAITIEVGRNAQAELDEIKKQAEQYSGLMNITEEKIQVAGKTADKIRLKNNVAGTVNVYIIIGHMNYDYILKYSEESSDFVDKVDSAINSFSFL
jgi:hypothetical protein